MSKAIQLSVIICTHNPRADFLSRTLKALELQTLPTNEWELLLIDNASAQQLGALYPISWHPSARCIREDELGLTAARLRGIREAKAELHVFVDDDNLLAADYLQSVLALSREIPQLGVFGSARITPEYEQNPTPELAPYCSMLAIRNEVKDAVSRSRFLVPNAAPFGAGLCVRVTVASEFARRKKLGGFMFGRKGRDLVSSEDLEFSLIASDCGLEYGVFHQLSLTHLIPAERVSVPYLLTMAEGQSYSNNLLLKLRNLELGQPPRSVLRDMITAANVVVSTAASRGVHRKFAWKRGCGNLKALRHFRSIMKKDGKGPV